MGRLFLVRHGQASFGADNYDQLSPMGYRQCVRLGEYFRERGFAFEGVLTGTLQRHAQSYEGISEGMQVQQTPLLWPGLNEYDSHAVIAAIHPGKLEKPRTPEMVRHHFRLLRDGLKAWMAGTAQPVGMPSFAEFSAGVSSALDHVRTRHSGDVLIVSSGGPISTAVGLLLNTPPETMIELNLRIRNSSVTEFTFTPKRHALVTYNTLPHLDGATFSDWVTHT